MNTQNKYRDWILLEASNELPVWKRIRLRRALARDPALGAYRDALHQSETLIRDTPLPTEPSDFAINMIMRAGADSTGSLKQASPHKIWRPALVYGTLSMVLLVAGMVWLTHLNGADTTYLTEADIDYWMQSLFGSLEEVAWLNDGSEMDPFGWDL